MLLIVKKLNTGSLDNHDNQVHEYIRCYYCYYCYCYLTGLRLRFIE